MREIHKDMMNNNMSTKSRLFQVRSVDAFASIAPNISQFGESFTVLFQWNKSIYKLVWKHMLAYFIIYISLSILYDFILDENSKKNFMAVAQYCSQHTGSINLMIMLGFFTSTAMQRLFAMQTTMPGTARSITLFIMSLKPNLPEGPAIIDQFSRWQILTWILTFRAVCQPLRMKYPDLQSLQIAGFLTEKERQLLEYDEIYGKHPPRPLIVIDWMLLLLKETFQQNRFFCDFNFLKNVEALMSFKKSCGNIIKFASQNIPHAIIQAVVLSVYCFGMVTLVARNFKDNSDYASGIFLNYIPIWPGVQFFVYFAWLSFGRGAVNPFGDDEDDINVKALVQNHLEDAERLKGYLYGMELSDVFPELPQREFNECTRF